MDAAIAAAMVQTVVDPQMCGIAGFGSMQIFMPEMGGHSFIDFHGHAPIYSTLWTSSYLVGSK
jgi:gamma-glutamyltranspeptidase/glutathione hydrolase